MRRVPLAPLLLVAGAVAMVFGVLGGLGRLGFAVPVGAAAVVHGALMVHGVFGTLIATERAVALQRPLAYVAPAASASGALLSLATPELFLVSAALYLVSALALAAVSGAVIHVQNAAFTKLLALATLPLVAAAVGLLGGASPSALAPAWMAFLAVTIAGERVELSRLTRPSPAATRALAALLTAAALTGGAAQLTGAAGALLTRLFGVTLALVALLLARLDIARRTARLGGLPRFAAIALYAGFAWLAAGGALVAARGLIPGHGSYDAALHAVFVGFVLSMVFAHAPIVLPAVAGVRIPFHASFYAPLTLLHGSLALRVLGDALGEFAWRRAGGLGHGLAILTFVLTIVVARLRGARTSHAGGALCTEVRHAP